MLDASLHVIGYAKSLIRVTEEMRETFVGTPKKLLCRETRFCKDVVQQRETTNNHWKAKKRQPNVWYILYNIWHFPVCWDISAFIKRGPRATKSNKPSLCTWAMGHGPTSINEKCLKNSTPKGAAAEGGACCFSNISHWFLLAHGPWLMYTKMVCYF